MHSLRKDYKEVFPFYPYPEAPELVAQVTNESTASGHMTTILISDWQDGRLVPDLAILAPDCFHFMKELHSRLGVYGSCPVIQIFFSQYKYF